MQVGDVQLQRQAVDERGVLEHQRGQVEPVHGLLLGGRGQVPPGLELELALGRHAHGRRAHQHEAPRQGRMRGQQQTRP
jgi:hypothetical protein